MTNERKLILLSLLFFISGSCGLIYQVAWQRVLYSSFGTDVDSVAIIVSAFMLGLGLGALAGGKLVDRFSNQALILFCLCELGIGIYGTFSYWLILSVGDLVVSYNLFVIALTNFLLVLIPALLMGATLPILIAYISKYWGNIGKTTGHLYAINTFGATLGAFLTGFVLFNRFELPVVINFAVTLNLLVAVIAYFSFRNVQDNVTIDIQPE